MDLRDLCRLYSGCPWPDERERCMSASKCMHKTDGDQDAENAQSDLALFALGYDAMYWGDYKSAQCSFQKVAKSGSSESGSSSLNLRAALYAQYCRIWSIWPRSLSFLSDHGSIFVIMASAQNNITEATKSITQISHQISRLAIKRLEQIPGEVFRTVPDDVLRSFVMHQSGDISQPGFAGLSAEQRDLFAQLAIDNLEADLLQIIWFSYRAQQLTLGPLISQAAGMGPVSGQDSRDEMHNSCVAKIDRCKKVANHLSLHHLAAHLDRLTYELCRAEVMNSDDWSSTSFPILQKLEARYRESKDSLGLASILLVKVESSLSPSYTSPLALNLVVTDGQNATLHNTHFDRLEASISLPASQVALEYLSEAFILFGEAGSQLGCGLVQLYEGTIAHADAINQESLTLDERRKKYYLATQSIEHALRHLDRRGQFHQLALVHQVLLSIRQELHEDLLSKCASIGSWAFRTDNFAFGQFLGLLIARYGRRAWSDQGRADIAFLSYACSVSCLRQIPQLSFALLQVLGSSLDLHLTLSDHKGSRRVADDFHDQFGRVISDLRTCSLDTRWRSHIRSVALNLMRTSQHLLARAYYMTKDEKMITQWISELRILDAEFDEGQEAAARQNLPYLTTRFKHGSGASNDATYVARSREVQDTVLSFYLYDIQYERLLQSYNVPAAERVLEDFLQPLISNSASDGHLLLAIHVCHRLEKYELGREILNRLQDHALFKGEVDSESNLGRPWSSATYQTRLFLPDEASNAVSLCVESQHWQRGKAILDSILSRSTGFLNVGCSERDRDDMWHRLLNAGFIAEHTQETNRAFGYYIEALQTFELRNQSIQGEDARLNSLYTEASNRLVISLARISVGYNIEGKSVPYQVMVSPDVNIQCSTWNEYAVAFLEIGKARALLETKSFQSTLAHGTEVETIEVYQRRLLADLEAIPQDQRTGLEVEEIAALQSKLSSKPDRGPMVGRTVSPALTVNLDSFDFIAPDAAVVEFGISRDGLVLACITSTGIEHVSTQPLTSLQGQRSVFEYLHTVFCREGSHQNEPAKSSGPEIQRLLELAATLSQSILLPLRDIIAQKSHLIFIPAHPILGFPFSGLVSDGQPLFRTKAVSQSPSLATLRALCSSPVVVHEPKVSSVAKPGRWMDRTSEEPPLYMAGLESLFIGRMFGTQPLQATHLGKSDFLDVLHKSDVVHVGTHGNLHEHSPWQASISLKSKLRVIDLLTAQSRAALLVFGACLAGIGRATAGSDVTGFSHAVLASGTRAFIGALWRVDDISTMLLMREFFNQLGQLDASVNIAELWRRAQCRLYDMDKEAINNLRATLVQDWEQMAGDGLRPRPGEFVPKGKTFLKVAGALEDLSSTFDPTDPFHWAAFTIVGNGDLRFDNISLGV